MATFSVIFNGLKEFLFNFELKKMNGKDNAQGHYSQCSTTAGRWLLLGDWKYIFTEVKKIWKSHSTY